MSAARNPVKIDDDLKTGLKVSVGLHIALVVAFSVKTLFFSPSEAIDYSAAIRVDIVALPDKMQQEAPLPPKQEETKPEPAPPKPPAAKAKPQEVVLEKPLKAPKKETEAIRLDKDKKKQKDAIEKLKAMAAIEEMKKEAEKESKKAAGLGQAQTPPGKIKGNVLAPGTALTGLNRLQHDNYLATLDHQIKQNWFLPEWLSKKSYRTQIRLKIDEKGQVLSREIILSSGNSSYDELALETIDKSAPFVPPPEKFISIVAVSGLVIGFPE